jgi:hypothetical protein
MEREEMGEEKESGGPVASGELRVVRFARRGFAVSFARCRLRVAVRLAIASHDCVSRFSSHGGVVRSPLAITCSGAAVGCCMSRVSGRECVTGARACVIHRRVIPCVSTGSPAGNTALLRIEHPALKGWVTPMSAVKTSAVLRPAAIRVFASSVRRTQLTTRIARIMRFSWRHVARRDAGNAAHRSSLIAHRSFFT